MIETLIILIFILGYGAIALEAKTGVNKSAAALLTAALCWVLFAFKAGAGGLGQFGPIFEAAAQVVFFLIGAMTIVQLMDAHNGFQVIADMLRTKDKRALLWVMALATFFLSSILDNLTTAIVMVSLFHRLIHDKEDRLIFGGVVIIAANAGGSWSPIGDVTTTMLWIGGQVSTFGIMHKLFVPSLIALLVPLVWFSCAMKKEDLAVSAGPVAPLPAGAKRVFFLGLGALIFVPIFKMLTGLPPVLGMLFGVGVMWAVTDRLHGEKKEHLKVHKVLAKVDFSSALFFLGILLAVGVLDASGILRALSIWMDGALGSKDLIATVIGLASAVVDNVPLTAATMGMYNLAQHPMDSKLWELLAYA
ncbi:MAG: sodium:proton antiporter NhaD, partial [Candidatus Omnitrophica bacterium]|nr:sodium:proton antiporter NhaD [Candidatus Omnitrophota bacterium]